MQSRGLSSVAQMCSLQQLVGNTRLVKLSHASKLTGCNIFGKCEYENPGQSIKDRAALQMILEAEEQGLLVRGEPGVIIEGTAGNTGIGLALAAAVFGYKCVICIANTQSEEKKDLLRVAGAHLVQVPAVPYTDPQNYVHVAKRLGEDLAIHSSYRSFYANQWDNHANRRAHIKGTGPEIVKQVAEQTNGGVVHSFSCAVGTGGTLTGVAEYLRSVDPEVKIALTDPCGAKLKSYYETGELMGHGSSISEGIGQGRITGNLEGFVPDMTFEIPDDVMVPVLNDLQKYEGLALGGSAAINVAGAMEVAKKLGPGHNCVTVLCDLGNRYASKLYNPSFLRSKGLPVAPWLETDPDETDKEFGNVLSQAINSCCNITL